MVIPANKKLSFKRSPRGSRLPGRVTPILLSVSLRASLGPLKRLSPHMHFGKGAKQPKNVQQPENDRNDYHAIQNGLDGPLHGNEAIHQPQENTHYDENFQQLKQRHDLSTFLVSRANASRPPGGVALISVFENVWFSTRGPPSGFTGTHERRMPMRWMWSLRLASFETGSAAI